MHKNLLQIAYCNSQLPTQRLNSCLGCLSILTAFIHPLEMLGNMSTAGIIYGRRAWKTNSFEDQNAAVQNIKVTSY